jgi:hypothetical protein
MNFTVGGTEVELDPILPLPVWWVIAILLTAVAAFLYWRSGTRIGPVRNLLLLVLRLTGLALVLVLLLQPSRREFLPPLIRDRITAVAVDTSRSMNQQDAGRLSRFDAARDLLLQSGAVSDQGIPNHPRRRVFEFHTDIRQVQESLLEIAPRGSSTRLHSSVLSLLNSTDTGEALDAIILLTDGHDFELVNPVKTGAAARARQTPIYAVPLGRQGRVRDVSVRITGFQPYTYVKQSSRITASLRLIGCEFETIEVHLLRHGEVAQTRRVQADEFQEVPVEFEVVEPEVGQFEYEVRATPLQDELDAANNSAMTYLNVIDQRIRVLLLEGDPYWDTTFLQRSLMRNDKFEVDSLIRYAPDRVRTIRKSESDVEWTLPSTLEQFATYDLILLGRAVETLLNPEQIALLDPYVRDRTGTVIFSRGRAFAEDTAPIDLEPVLWGEPTHREVRVDPTSEGRSLAAFRSLNPNNLDGESLPTLFNAHAESVNRPLTTTLAQATDRDTGTTAPAIVQRRYGRGQVVSVGVEGLWRWSLNAQLDGDHLPFDRFWDQLILWLLAGRDFVPNRQFSFRPNSANIQLGSKAHFRLTQREPDPQVNSIPLTVFFEEKETGRTTLTPSPTDASRLTGEFLPDRVGRYRAHARFPDGTEQDSRFIVFNENLEETEVATDTLGLRRLCESSGGRLLDPTELAPLLAELGRVPSESSPKSHLVPLWNSPWVFYAIGVILGLDWYLRRRWGLC